MTTAPRTRSRQRPHAQTDEGTQKNTGEPVSHTDQTNHRAVGQTSTTATVGPNGELLLMARVCVSDGVTLNMGDFNSFRRDVRLEMDVVLPGEADNGGVPTDEQNDVLARAYDQVQDWVTDRLAEAADDAREYFDQA